MKKNTIPSSFMAGQFDFLEGTGLDASSMSMPLFEGLGGFDDFANDSEPAATATSHAKSTSSAGSKPRDALGGATETKLVWVLRAA